MFTSTRAVLAKSLADFKRSVYIIGIIANLFYVLSIAYAIFDKNGLIYVNIPMLAISVAYFVFYIVAYRHFEGKRIKRKISEINRWFKIFAHTLTLIVTVYSLYAATEKPHFLSVLFAVLTTVSWLFQIISSLTIRFFEVRAELLIAAIEEDTEGIRRPINAVSSVISKIKGEEPRESKPQASGRIKEKIKKIKEDFVAKKKAEKLARKQKRGAKIEASDEKETANK